MTDFGSSSDALRGLRCSRSRSVWEELCPFRQRCRAFETIGHNGQGLGPRSCHSTSGNG